MSNTIPHFARASDCNDPLAEWLFASVATYIRPRVLLVGKEIDSMLKLILKNEIPVHICNCVNSDMPSLKIKYENEKLVRAFHDIDFLSKNTETDHSLLKAAFKTVVFINTPQDNLLDKTLLKNVKHFLAHDGQVIITMPALTVLYGDLDLNLEDWKEMDRKSLNNKLSGFQIQKTRYFYLDALGIEQRMKEKEAYVIAVAGNVSA